MHIVSRKCSYGPPLFSRDRVPGFFAGVVARLPAALSHIAYQQAAGDADEEDEEGEEDEEKPNRSAAFMFVRCRFCVVQSVQSHLSTMYLVCSFLSLVVFYFTPWQCPVRFFQKLRQESPTAKIQLCAVSRKQCKDNRYFTDSP